MPRKANKRNVVSKSRIAIVNGSLPIPDTAIALTERILSQVTNNGIDGIYDEYMLKDLGIDAPSFPYTPLSLPLFIPSGDLSFIDDVGKLAHMMLVMLKTITIVAVDHSEDDPHLLGSYVKGYGGIPKHIELNSRLIQKSSESNELAKIAGETKLDSFSFLCAIVLIHELAHAVMDVTNYAYTDKNGNNVLFNDLNALQYQSPPYLRQCFGRDTEHKSLCVCNADKSVTIQDISFYHVREESYANVLTYKVIASALRKQRKNGGIPYLTTFIAYQPDSYRLASKLYNEERILGWLKAKYNVLIDAATARSWMDTAELLLNNKIPYSYFSVDQRSLNLPWA